MWQNPRKAEDLVTFTEEILNVKLYFLCSGYYYKILNCWQNSIFLIKKSALTSVRTFKFFHNGRKKIEQTKQL